MTLPWNTEIMVGIAGHRTDWLTVFFNLLSDIGDVPGYILVITFIYGARNRDLGVRLAVLLLLTICVNHILKTVIMNPRPFAVDGTWQTMWAVSAGHIESLVLEYSTPSGHAMSAAAFYGYLAFFVRRRWMTILALAAAGLIGLSRPYLGVHYIEDIVLGWLLGGLFAWVAYRKGDRVVQAWQKFGWPAQFSLLLAFSTAIWLFTYAMGGTATDKPPLGVIGNLGFLTGVVLAAGFERRWLSYHAAEGSWLQKSLRCVLTIACLALPLVLLGLLADELVEGASLAGHIAKYVRYAVAGFSGLLLAPALFMRLGLASPAKPKATISP